MSESKAFWLGDTPPTTEDHLAYALERARERYSSAAQVEAEDETISVAPISGVPADAMPELDMTGLVPNSSLIAEIASIRIPTMTEIMRDEN